MEKKNRRIGAADLLLLCVSAVFFIGMLTVFGPCGPKEDGTWMTCHWAGQAVAGIAAVLLCLAAAHGIAGDPGVKAGLSIAIIPLSALAIVIPGNLIGMCMMDTMRCHAVMKPAVLLCSALMILSAGFDLFLRRPRAGQ